MKTRIVYILRRGDTEGRQSFLGRWETAREAVQALEDRIREGGMAPLVLEPRMIFSESVEEKG